MTEKIKIKYFTDGIELEKLAIGDWIDLKVAKDIFIRSQDFALVPLGVAMKLPDGYEAIVVPRSSTFKKHGILQTNSMGIIDNSYCGDNDQWYFPALNFFGNVTLKKGMRICQFRIQKKMPEIEFEVVTRLEDKDRGGFGSTGV